MAQREGRQDLAAQDAERKFTICDRCFASVPIGKTNCQECGAPILTEGQKNDQSDSLVYTELARANLLRLRGDYASAEAECLKILRQYPNNASAHTLLGDIYGEKGDFEQAVQWYELSLDLVPDPAVKERATSIRKRIVEREQLDTARELGVPAQRALKTKYVLAILIPVILLFIAAFVLGRKSASPDNNKNSSVTLPTIQPSMPGVEPKNGQDNKAVEVAEGSDLMLLEHLRSANTEGSKVLFVMQDPRLNVVTICYEVDDDKDIRATGARLALTELETNPDALSVTIRAMRGGVLLYTADVSRSRVNETKQPSWQADNKDNPSAWINYVLNNDWSNSTSKASGGQDTNGGGNGGVLPTSPQDTPKESGSPGSTDASSTGQTPVQGGQTPPQNDSGDFPTNKVPPQSPQTPNNGTGDGASGSTGTSTSGG
jgi:ribosomal protein L40E